MSRHREPFLFAERAMGHDVVEAQRTSVARLVDEVDPKELLRRPIEEIEAEIVFRLRLDMPVLQRDQTMSLPVAKIEIDVSRDPMRAFIPGRGPYNVKGSPIGIIRHRGEQHFDRDVAIQLRVVGAIHLAHAACAKRGEDLIGAKPRACR